MILVFVLAAIIAGCCSMYEKSLNFLLCLSVMVFNIMCALYFESLAIQDERSLFLSILTAISLCYILAATGSDHKISSKLSYAVMSFHSLGAWYLVTKLLWF